VKRPTKCHDPKCNRDVLAVKRNPSTTVYVHERGKKPSQEWGCAVSAVRRGER
jgi:hypothetical protein